MRVPAARGEWPQETAWSCSKDINNDPTVFNQLWHHDSHVGTAWPGQGKPEAPVCAAPCATGTIASLSQSPALISVASAGTKTTPGEFQQGGCGHLGVGEGDAQTEHNAISLFSLGKQAQKLSLCPASPPDPMFSSLFLPEAPALPTSS